MNDARVLFFVALCVLALVSYEWSGLGSADITKENKQPSRERLVDTHPKAVIASAFVTSSAALSVLEERIRKLESIVDGLREDIVNEREENNLLREWVTSQMFTMQSQGFSAQALNLSQGESHGTSGVVVGVDMTTSNPITLPPYRLRALWSKPKEGVVNAAFKEQVRAAMGEIRLERQMERRQRRVKRDLAWYTNKLGLNGNQQSELQTILARNQDAKHEAMKLVEKGKIKQWKKRIRSLRKERNNSIFAILDTSQQMVFQSVLDDKKAQKVQSGSTSDQ